MRVEVWLIGNSMVVTLDRWKVRGGRFVDDGTASVQLETVAATPVLIGDPIELDYQGSSGKYSATAPSDIDFGTTRRVIAHVTGTAPEGELDIREPVNVRTRTA